jgi:hypothetical protein
MTALNFALKLTIVLSLISHLSCVKVPVEVTLDKPIVLNEKDIEKIVKDIHKRLAAINLAPPGYAPGKGMVDPEHCSLEYKKWLGARFAEFRVPKKLVSAAEYAKDSTYPQILSCKSVDFNVEYTESAREAVESNNSQKSAWRFDLEEFRNAIASEECSKNLIDPEKKKLFIKNIGLLVTKNTLNVSSPNYKIYYTTKKITDDELAAKDAERDLVADGYLRGFARSKGVPPRYEGLWALDIAPDSEGFEELQENIGISDTDILAIPDVIGRDPEIVMVGDQPHFVVPHGSMAFYIALELSIKAEIADAMCAVRVYKKKQNTLDEERRAKFYGVESEASR